MLYSEMNATERQEELARLRAEYESLCALGLKMDMSRGKPCPAQLDLSEGLLTAVTTNDACEEPGCPDLRNYGLPDGVPAMRQIFSELLGLPEEQLYSGGSSSLSLMFDTLMRCMVFGAGEGGEPWMTQAARYGELKFLCPCPGYDRHFAITEKLGFRLIPVPMRPTGPDMDQVEALVKDDPAIKGIWCVPKYSNPTGITFSNETVERLASMKTAAADFRIFWDNAYAFHDLYDNGGDTLADLFEAAERYGNADRVFLFASFSKVTMAGGSVSVFGASKANMAFAKKIIAKQTICTDKLNQLRHSRFFGNAEGVREHMKKHAAILRPKFEAVEQIFEGELAPCGIGSWTKPKGGYFISLDLPAGTAKRSYALCAEAGVKLTQVGATFPYGIDPLDSNLRIAPSYPDVDELRAAAKVLCVCARIAYLEKNS